MEKEGGRGGGGSVRVPPPPLPAGFGTLAQHVLLARSRDPPVPPRSGAPRGTPRLCVCVSPSPALTAMENIPAPSPSLDLRVLNAQSLFLDRKRKSKCPVGMHGAFVTSNSRVQGLGKFRFLLSYGWWEAAGLCLARAAL